MSANAERSTYDLDAARVVLLDNAARRRASGRAPSDVEAVATGLLSEVESLRSRLLTVEAAHVRVVGERDALMNVLDWQLLLHPLPWLIEPDWTIEVNAADGTTIAKCSRLERGSADAERIIALAETREREMDADGVDIERLLNDDAEPSDD